MSERGRKLRASTGSVVVFLICALVMVLETHLTAGPGSGGSAPKACRDEDIPTAVALAWLCGNPFDSATGSPTQCACLVIDEDSQERVDLPLNFEWNLGQVDRQQLK